MSNFKLPGEWQMATHKITFRFLFLKPRIRIFIERNLFNLSLLDFQLIYPSVVNIYTHIYTYVLYLSQYTESRSTNT